MKASHNSATGERVWNVWARMLRPFCQCQTKTLKEQYDAGVRLFDIRVRWDKNKQLRCCHGLAMYDKTLDEVCREIGHMTDDVWVMVTYEGHLPDGMIRYFVSEVRMLAHFHGVLLGHVCEKCPRWNCLEPSDKQPDFVADYTKVTGWRRLLPLPWLWNLLREPKEEGKGMVMRDFI